MWHILRTRYTYVIQPINKTDMCRRRKLSAIISSAIAASTIFTEWVHHKFSPIIRILCWCTKLICNMWTSDFGKEIVDDHWRNDSRRLMQKHTVSRFNWNRVDVFWLLLAKIAPSFKKYFARLRRNQNKRNTVSHTITSKLIEYSLPSTPYIKALTTCQLSRCEPTLFIDYADTNNAFVSIVEDCLSFS